MVVSERKDDIDPVIMKRWKLDVVIAYLSDRSICCAYEIS